MPSQAILVVEDDPISRRLLEKGLKTGGHQVICTGNGREALAAFSDHFFPIVLTDWVMPEMDGLSLCRAIREKESERYVFIILLTSKDSHEDILSGFEAGADDYLTKPFNQMELLARINTGIRFLKQEKSLKTAEQEIRQYSEKLELMVQERTRQLEDSEKKYRTILENLKEGYYEVDLNGNITFFNDATCKITGYSKDELMGKYSLSLSDKAAAERLYEEYRSVYQTGQTVSGIEWELITKSGDVKFLDNSVSLIRDEKGKPIGFRGLMHDITQRKALEEELIQKTAAAEAANKAKSEFLANLSHEIRTPLNGIIGMTEIALETTRNKEQQKVLKTIDAETNSLYGLINNILDFSKIEARKMTLEEIDFDLSVTLSDLTTNIRMQATRNGLDFNVLISEDVPMRLVGDPGRLRQILNNLLTNALKFTHEGEIALIVELERDLGKTVEIRFVVKDTGVGIAAEKQNLIFEGFTQADGSTTRKYGGTGLGTTISKQLAELMGGKIGLESTEGVGSLFWFTVVVLKQSGKKAPVTKRIFDLKNLRLMLVHGNHARLKKQAAHFKAWKCRVESLASGRKALLTLQKTAKSSNPFKMVVTGGVSADIGGFELAQKIRADKAFNHVPILMLTGSGMLGDAAKCNRIGINGYVTGAFTPADLRKACLMILRQFDEEGSSKAGKLVTRYTVAEEKGVGASILLAEDYPTNQQVAMRYLTGAGYEVDLAENGQQVIAAVQKNSYDLILMDMQMPVMDGYEATKAIRAWEAKMKDTAGNGFKPIPIIATTAHAMKEDRKKCLDAGMDDYITKPLRRERLLAMVEKWLFSDASSERSETDASLPESVAQCYPVTTDTPMDFEKAMAEFEGDKAFLLEVLAEFIQNTEKQIALIAQALSEENTDQVRKEAHAIKGGAAELTANKLANLSFEMEKKGKSSRLDGGADLLAEMKNELARLAAFV